MGSLYRLTVVLGNGAEGMNADPARAATLNESAGAGGH